MCKAHLKYPLFHFIILRCIIKNTRLCNLLLLIIYLGRLSKPSQIDDTPSLPIFWMCSLVQSLPCVCFQLHICFWVEYFGEHNSTIYHWQSRWCFCRVHYKYAITKNQELWTFNMLMVTVTFPPRRLSQPPLLCGKCARFSPFLTHLPSCSVTSHLDFCQSSRI